MKVANYEWDVIQRIVNNKDAQMAKTLFETWLDEKCAPVYKKGWLDCCGEYDISDTFYDDDDDDHWEGEGYDAEDAV